MVARFQINVQRGAFHWSGGVAYRLDFGVRAAKFFVPTLADNFSVLHKNRSNARVRTYRARASCCKFQRPSHRLFIGHIVVAPSKIRGICRDMRKLLSKKLGLRRYGTRNENCQNQKLRTAAVFSQKKVH
jgi:hypothetical protein